MAVESKTRRCPYCSEEIAPGALVCKHCHAPLMKKQKPKPPFWRGQFMLGVYSGIFFMILMIYIFNKAF